MCSRALCLRRQVEQLSVFPETGTTHDRRAVAVYKDSSVVEFMSIGSSAECSGCS